MAKTINVPAGQWEMLQQNVKQVNKDNQKLIKTISGYSDKGMFGKMCANLEDENKKLKEFIEWVGIDSIKNQIDDEQIPYVEEIEALLEK